MSDWLSAVGEATQAHRNTRAVAHEKKASRRRNAARLDGATEEAANQASAWHESRAKGQRERPERVENCGKDTLAIRCRDCGLIHERPTRCGCGLLCVRCRGVRARRTRMRFRAARAAVLAEGRARGLLNPNRRGGAWSEKFLTLTAPHLPDDTIDERITRVHDAWQWFARCLQTWQRERKLPSIEWFRVFEWTIGLDERGHPHLHIWLFSPYLDRELLSDWWRAAIRRNCPDPAVQVNDVFIEAVNKDIEQELVKYLTKDIDEHGEKLAPEIYAQVYCSLDQRRTCQASKGFMARADKGPQACSACGSKLPRHVQRKKNEEAAKS